MENYICRAGACSRRLRNETVIASQSSDWRGNLPVQCDDKRKRLCLFFKRQRRNLPLRYHSCSAFQRPSKLLYRANPAQPTLGQPVRCAAQRGYKYTFQLPCTNRQLSEWKGHICLSLSLHISYIIAWWDRNSGRTADLQTCRW